MLRRYASQLTVKSSCCRLPGERTGIPSRELRTEIQAGHDATPPAYFAPWGDGAPKSGRYGQFDELDVVVGSYWFATPLNGYVAYRARNFDYNTLSKPFTPISVWVLYVKTWDLSTVLFSVALDTILRTSALCSVQHFALFA